MMFQVVKEVIETGCQAVPKADPTGDEFSWRLSFSRGELLLAKNVTSCARLSYVAVKIYWKNNLKTVCPALRSYHLKTLFYHFLETLDHEVLNCSDVEELSLHLLNFVYTKLKARQCPHYFISTINLFDFQVETNLSETMKNIDQCLQIIQKTLNSQSFFQNLFSKNSKTVMTIKSYRDEHPYLYHLLTILMIIINMMAVCGGAFLYVTGLFSLVSLLISCLYSSIVLIPVVIIISVIYHCLRHFFSK